MTKSTVTRLFVGSVITVVAGLVMGFVAALAAISSDILVMRGPDVVGVEPSAVAWSLVGAAIVAVLAVIGGAIGGLVSWIGALLNTAELEDKTWFVLLLVLGILSFGLVAMVAYVIAGPDGTLRRSDVRPPRSALVQ
jgi:MFS family permease